MADLNGYGESEELGEAWRATGTASAPAQSCCPAPVSWVQG
ncbi:MAG TPA: hypothetical protein VFE60_03370 [Roseiarcus sp.]|jgi:hypothetical protein|nr:hypothetical protein [Roseiarcus sp.]